jgi:hypothetical protein
LTTDSDLLAEILLGECKLGRTPRKRTGSSKFQNSRTPLKANKSIEERLTKSLVDGILDDVDNI